MTAGTSQQEAMMPKRWSVWVSQSFGQHVEVEAATAAEAQEKAVDAFLENLDPNELEDDGEPVAGTPEPTED